MNAEIMESHAKFCLAQAIARDAPVLADLGRERAGRPVAIEEHLELPQGGHSLSLVAFGRMHLRKMAHRQLVLRVIGTRVLRKEREELAVLVGGEHERLG